MRTDVTDARLARYALVVMVAETKSDQELLDLARDGDAVAFGVFFERYQSVVLAYLGRRTRQRDAAADLCGEVFARALIGLHRRRAVVEDSAGGWLLTIARNALVDSVRRGRVEERARRQLGIERLLLTDEDLERIDAQTGDLDRVLALVEQLPEAQRTALKARILDERDYADIAADLGCSDLVVRQRVSRALKTLRSKLEAQP
jgi:RNA polymerase sigma factor (sigma-70 family)